MKKYVKDLQIQSVELLRNDYVLLKLTDPTTPLPPIRPGQFVEVQITGSPRTFLRRPISVNFVDYEKNELWLLIHAVGDGTRTLLTLKAGEWLNCIFPLGNGFTMPQKSTNLLLVGGGVGTAPLLYYGERLREAGVKPIFLLGGRSERDLLQLEEFEKYGELCLATEDGALGVKGFVTNHPILSLAGLKEAGVKAVATCGPKPMMKAVANVAAAAIIPCEASLENLMACGLGACLCCVEKNREGHNVCVCKDGPVFNTKELNWN